MTEPPGEAGFGLPAEFEPHEATWMAWPHDERTWVAGLDATREAFLTMIEALSQGERIDLIVRPADREQAQQVLSTRDTGHVVLHEKDHADAWLRDTGPTVLVHEDGRRIAVDWRFDAWGGKYEDLKRDDDLAAFVAERADLETHRVDLVVEGGALEPDGQGRLLTTRDCLVDGRGHDPNTVEDLFQRVLGVDEVVWLSAHLAGDDTDGHVDTVARFLDPTTIAVATQPDAKDPDHETLADLATQVRTYAQEQDPPLDVVELPGPDPVEVAGRRRPASYANFYVANDVVLLPVFDDPNDRIARCRLAEAYPNREVVDVPARPLVAGYGACHCLTQPLPAPPSTTR